MVGPDGKARVTFVSLEIFTPDLGAPQGLEQAIRKLNRDYPWVVEAGWDVEYWGLRRAGAGPTRDPRYRARGLALPAAARLPSVVAMPLAWLVQAVLALRARTGTVLVAHTPRSAAGVVLARRVSRRASQPLVVRVQSRASSRARLVTKSEARARWIERIEGQALEQADLVLPMGDFTRSYSLSQGARPARVVTLPFPVGWDGPLPDGLVAVTGDPMRVTCAARLQPEKGVDVLLRAIALVAEAFPGVVLDIAGNGPERPRLVALASELGISGNVRFRGWLAPADMPAFYAGSAVSVLPSLVEEGFGMSLIEAGLVGCALVGTDHGGIRDIVVPGRTGLLVAPGDSAALGQALGRLLGDPKWAASLGAGAMVEAQRYVSQRAAAIAEVRRRMAALVPASAH